MVATGRDAEDLAQVRRRHGGEEFLEMTNDTISRQAAIDVLHGYFDGVLETDTICPKDIYNLFEIMPSAQPENCEECKHMGKWESEVEYGYPSPCTRCKRRVEDHYER